MNARRTIAALLTAVLATAVPAGAYPSHAVSRAPSIRKPANMARAAVWKRYVLPGHRVATVYNDGIETLTGARGKPIRRALVNGASPGGPFTSTLPSTAELLRPLLQKKSPLPYAPNQLVVVFAEGYAPAVDSIRRSKRATRTTAFTTSSQLNRVLQSIGTDSLDRVAKRIKRSRLSRMHAAAVSRLHGEPMLDVANAYVVHFSNAPMERALAALRKAPGVQYASRNWYVSTMRTPSLVLSSAATHAAALRARQAALTGEMRSTGIVPHDVPSNYAVSASAQSLLNAPGVNALTAYDEIEETFHQLPGQGELIANVSIGDIDDTTQTNNVCYSTAGATAHLIGGQHYIDWPSMPLIPAYVVDSSGNASGSAEVCGVDPTLGEVGLDFSMMAPLPHELQRPNATGSGYSDLLGIAPGARYELFVPQSGGATQTDILATMLAAVDAPQRPDIITASIGFGFDQYGFPGRFIEDDPLSAATVAGIVNGYGIVVCLSANDGTRTYTPAAIGPAGGSAATNLVTPSGQITDINDLFLTTIPSADRDSGSIDVGGTTLDDIYAAPPSDPGQARYAATLAWPETRWTGFAEFSSGFGSRVDISAPSDNVLAMSGGYNGGTFCDYNCVAVSLNGGTSASAPEVAAAAAVVMQVARLTGRPFATPQDVRAFLVKTARKVPNVPQADQSIAVGPQLDLGNAVETLLRKAGKRLPAAAPRVAIAQRREAGDYGGAFLSDTAPEQIDLEGPQTDEGSSGFYESGRNQIAPITIAPDWEGVVPGTKFRLTVAGKPHAVLATTPWARLMPEQILAAAGLPLASTSQRTVHLQYSASVGIRSVTTAFSLVFGPADKTHEGGFAPAVAPVSSGASIPVSYDLTGVRGLHNPTLIVTEPGRMFPSIIPGYGLEGLFHPSYTAALTGTKGTVHVPVSALQGAGVYGFTIEYRTYGISPTADYTNFSFTRVVAGSSAKAAPATISTDGVTFSHYATLDQTQQYEVRYDVSGVPKANGAIVEIGAPAPNIWSSYNTLDNPNGSIVDDNGVDTGSVYTKTVSGTSGTVTLSGAGTLTRALYNQVRVIPMNGATPAGESSDPSMIAMNGIYPSDGNPLIDFKIGNGSYGDLNTLATDAAGGDILASHILPFSLTNYSFVTGFGPTPDFRHYDEDLGTIFSGNLQLFARYNIDASATDPPNFAAYPPQYGIASLANAATTGPVNGPAGEYVQAIAYNRQSDLALVELAGDTASTPVYFSTFTLPSLTFGTQYDVTAAFYPSGSPSTWVPGSVELDPGLDLGVVETGPLSTTCIGAGGNTVSTVDLSSGAITAFPSAGVAGAYTSTYDPATHTLATADDCANLVLTNVQTKATSAIALPGGELPYFLSADTTHDLILVGDQINPDYLTDNNAASVIYVMNENGAIQETVTAVQFDGIYEPGYLELNEPNRRGFVPEFTGTQVEPFAY